MVVLGDFQTSVRKALDEIDPNWEKYEGLVICGTHQPRSEEIDYLIHKIRKAREDNTPYLGICYGMQLGAVEYARNVLKIEDATSEEFGEGTFVVKKRKEGLNVGLKNGESYWNNYEVDLPDWKIPANFFISQFHPEYQSSKEKPHPLLKNFIEYAKEHTMAM